MPHNDNHQEVLSEKKLNHWEQELLKPSLKEPPFKNKSEWIKPLTIFHTLAFRGLDKKDYYEPPEYDAWDHQAWNTDRYARMIPRCANYYIDLQKCQQYLKAEYPLVKTSYIHRKDYCWKLQDNYSNCKRTFIRKNMKYVQNFKVFPEDH